MHNFKEYKIDDLINLSINNNIKICGLNVDLLSKDIVKKIKKNNISITTYSNKNISLSDANYFFSLGVDSIFIDNPIDLLGKF